MKNLQSDDFRVPITDEVIEEKKNQPVNEKNYLQNLLETVVRNKEDVYWFQLNVVNATKNGFTIKVCASELDSGKWTNEEQSC